jgi:hypothetical protein
MHGSEAEGALAYLFSSGIDECGTLPLSCTRGRGTSAYRQAVAGSRRGRKRR